MEFYTLAPDKVVEKLNSSSSQGLSSQEAQQRLLKHGPNLLPSEKPFNILNIFLAQLKDPMIIILIVAAILTYSIGEIKDFYIILAIIVIEFLIGFVEEYRSEKIVSRLAKYSQTTGKIIRDGQIQQITADEIVPGDIIKIDSGDRVPADCRVLSTEYVLVNEAILTGESVPVEKNSLSLPPEIPINERSNSLFQGTFVAQGSVLAIVIATGTGTELGKIAAQVKKIQKPNTPLQKRLANFTKIIAIIAICITLVIIVAGLILDKEIIETILLAISVAVSAIPEGFPIIVSIALVVGMARLAKKQVIIKHLPSVETLGSTSLICMDKTGTLTENKLSVKKILMADGLNFQIDRADYSPQGNYLLDGEEVSPIKYPHLEILLTASALCNNSSIEKKNGEWIAIGDPTESALVAAAAKAELDPNQLNLDYSRQEEIPFQSGQNYMATLHHSDKQQKRFIFLKGSPEAILQMCSYQAQVDKTIKLNGKDKHDWLEEVENLAQKSLRVLAVAYKEAPGQGNVTLDDTNLKYGLVFLGLVALADPVRSTAMASLRTAKQAGLDVVIITGDHPTTALNIAQSLGMKIGPENIITGSQLSQLNDQQFTKMADDIQIYARVLPEQKYRIVEFWQQKGRVVAMTGDGVNDAPALKRADIGIAMGDGTDVAKEAAEIILLENNFNRIIDTIREGRSTYENIKKTVLYLLGHNLGEVLIILLSMVFRLPLPLLPTQILWMNVVTDGVVDEALIFEPPEADIMKRAPRSASERFLNAPMFRRILIIGLYMTLAAFIVFTIYLDRTDIDYARTIVFTLMAFFSIFGVYANRSIQNSVMNMSIFRNPWLFYAALLSVGLQLIVVYLPALNKMFHTVPLKITDLLILLLVSSTLFMVIELEKYLLRFFESRAALQKN